MERQEDEKIIVQSLIGGSDLPFYVRCLKSLLAFCQERIDLQLHTDGSLSQEDKDSIYAELDGTLVTIPDTSQNTSRVLDCLQGRPNCQKVRKDSIWGIEFFDPIFAFPDDPISFYLDADILFLHPFSGLFDRNQVKNGAIFLSDTQWDAYSFRPWHMLIGKNKPQAVRGITTGLVFWDKAAIDWDYLEWFLGENNLHQIPEWIIPSAQAGLATRCEAKTIAPRQITNLYPNARIQEDTFGVHLLGSYRKEWMEKLEAREKKQIENLPTILPSFEECVSQNVFGYSLRQMRRWKNTRLNLW
ncbi:MAG: hypothetical protein P8N49_04150 [Opitutales bacterium]|nr:hypothetical protein [Opitutales bacterium]